MRLRIDWEKQLAGLGLAFALVLAPQAGFAHSQLTSSTPTGAVEAAGPSAANLPPAVVAPGDTQKIELRFDQPVTINLGAIRVFESDGSQRTIEPAQLVDDNKTVTASTGALPEGSYVVSWRAISADSHPVSGAFSFQVGESGAEDTEQLLQRVLSESGAPVKVGATFTFVRFLAYLALILLVGSLLMLAWLWPAGWSIARTKVLVWASWASALVATVAGIGLQGAYAAGLSLGSAVQGEVIRDVLDQRFGQAWGARGAALVVLAVVMAIWSSRIKHGASASSRLWPVAATAVAVAALVPAPFAGHAITDDLPAFAVAVDVVHLTAVSFWIGGLALMGFSALKRAPLEDLRNIVPRFSRAAFIAVGVIVATGVIQGWRRLGDLSAVGTTDYGRLLLAKVTAFLVLVALGALSRKWVQKRYGNSDSEAGGADVTASGHRLRRLVQGETAVATVVVLLTALLVAANPSSVKPLESFSTEMTDPNLLIAVTVDPLAVGRSDLHFYSYTPAGVVTDVTEFKATMSLPGQEIGPVEIPTAVAGKGHFSALGYLLPVEGKWILEVDAVDPKGEAISTSTELVVPSR